MSERDAERLAAALEDWVYAMASNVADEKAGDSSWHADEKKPKAAFIALLKSVDP